MSQQFSATKNEKDVRSESELGCTKWKGASLRMIRSGRQRGLAPAVQLVRASVLPNGDSGTPAVSAFPDRLIGGFPQSDFNHTAALPFTSLLVRPDCMPSNLAYITSYGN